MNVVIKASVALAVLVAVLSSVLAFSGMHKSNPLVGQLLFLAVAILLTAVCVFWGLKQTAADSGYLKQLMNGALIGLIAGVLIFAFSLLLLGVLMPNYIQELREGMTDWLQTSGLPEEQIQRQIEALEGATAFSQSVPGLIGTFLTSTVLAAVIGIFVRRK